MRYTLYAKPPTHTVYTHTHTHPQADFKTAHKWLKTWAVALQKKAEGAASNETLLSELNVLRLDVHALVVDILLRINRADLAEQELKVMNKIDDDAPVSLLWTGYVKLGSDALKLFSQLADMHGTTQLLLNAVGLAQMSTGAYEQALDTFEEALAIRDSDPDTIINHLTALKQVKPHADIRSQIEQLVANHPSHPWVCYCLPFSPLPDMLLATRGVFWLV